MKLFKLEPASGHMELALPGDLSIAAKNGSVVLALGIRPVERIENFRDGNKIRIRGRFRALRLVEPQEIPRLLKTGPLHPISDRIGLGLIFSFYSVAEVNGKLVPRANGRLLMDLAAILGRPLSPGEAVSFDPFFSGALLCRTRLVVRDSRQRPRNVFSRYSVISEVLGRVGGEAK